MDDDVEVARWSALLAGRTLPGQPQVAQAFSTTLPRPPQTGQVTTVITSPAAFVCCPAPPQRGHSLSVPPVPPQAGQASSTRNLSVFFVPANASERVISRS